MSVSSLPRWLSPSSVLALICLCLMPRAHANEFIRDFASAQALIQSGRVHSVQTFTDHLHPEFFIRVHPAYDSQNPFHNATIDDPRVLTRTVDATKIFAFHGNERIELAEWDEATWRIKPATFTFHPQDSSRKPIIDAAPRCVPCHASADRPDEFRHIWDIYPDWSGFIGSSHNLYMWLGIHRGLSLMPPFEFEAKALRNYIDTGHPIISRAVFEPIDRYSRSAVREFAIRQPSKAARRIANSYQYFGNSQFKIPHPHAQELRLLPILSTMNEEQGNRMLEMLAKRLVRLNLTEGSGTVRVKWVDAESKIENREEAYYRKKLARFNKHVRMYGTALDKRLQRDGRIFLDRGFAEVLVTDGTLRDIPLGLSFSSAKDDVSYASNFQGQGKLSELMWEAEQWLMKHGRQEKMLAALQCAGLVDR